MNSVRKTLLSIAFIIVSVICNGQIKTYEYPSRILTEKGIERLLDEAKQNKLPDTDLKKIEELLQKEMKKQEDRKTAQRAGNPHVNSSSCINPGFENGTNSNWDFYSANIAGIILPCNTCATNTGAVNTVVSMSTTVPGQCYSGIDYFGSFPIVPYLGSTYSLLLNDTSAGGNIMRASYTFSVDPSDCMFTFQYAAVLNSGGHASGHKPYFHVSVTDNTNGNVVPCTDFYEIDTTLGWNLSPILGGSINPSSVYYKPWTTVGLDLSFAVGHAVTVNFEVSDCPEAQHFGYVYLDADCGGMNSIQPTNLCGGYANLCGPAGYTNYTWIGPYSPGSSQCISTSVVGTYTVNMTSATGCPAPVYTFTVLPSTTLAVTYTLTQNVLPYTWDANPNYSSDVTNAVWYWGDGTSTSGMYPSHTYSAAGRYDICVTAIDSCGDSLQYCQNDSIYRLSNNTLSNMIQVNVVNNTTQVWQIANNKQELTLYPNPSGNNVTIQSEEKLGTIIIYNSIGEVVLQMPSSSTKVEIDISKLPVGIYTVKVQGRIMKLVKE